MRCLVKVRELLVAAGLRSAWAFGSSLIMVPDRYMQLDPSAAGSWDAALAVAAHEYEGHMYNFYTDNCHCFVAHFLNSLAYKGRRCRGAALPHESCCSCSLRHAAPA